VIHLRMPIALLGIGLVTGLAVADMRAFGQTQQAPGGQSAAARAGSDPDARLPYPVGMGEIMAFGVQPRHLTLASAVRAGDWAYAAYALKELGETFDRIPRAISNYQGQSTADLVGSFSKEPMNALDQAIKASDANRFKTAYAQLTQSCNGCHQKTGRAMVVMKVPDSGDALADQEFKASKP
jgi:hypothetical protein